MPNFRQAVQLNGIPPLGMAQSVVSKTTTYTIGANDGLILCNATSAAFTVTLPTAAGASGRIYTIKKTDATTNAVTLGTTSSQTIDGTTTRVIALQYGFLQVQSDGSNWQLVDTNLTDQTAADIQQLGTQAAGASGVPADAKHVHPASTASGTNLAIGGDGLSIAASGLAAVVGQISNTTAATTAATLTVPANEPVAGSVYEIDVWGLYGTAAIAPTLTWAVTWGATTLGSNAFTLTAGINTGAPARWRFKGSVCFVSTTLCYPNLRLEIVPSNSANTAASVFLYGSNSSSGVTVTTSSPQALALTMTWGTASTSNGFWVTGGLIWKAC